VASVGVGFGVGVADLVGVGVGLGVGVAATTSGDGTDTGELPRSALAGALPASLRGLTTAEAELAELAEPAEPETAALDVPGDPTCEVDPADDEWLLVHAASAAAQRIVTTQRAGVGLVVRVRLAIVPG
jgi:hypothetical protein